MRTLRSCLLAIAMAAASGVVGYAVRGPLADGWRSLGGASARAASSTPAAAELEALLAGACALLLAVAWLWLLAAVRVATWDVLRCRSAARPSMLRPPLVRALVATCLGATALTAPTAAHAGSLIRQVNDASQDLLSISAGSVARGPVLPGPLMRSPVRTGRHLLAGLPVPDRTTGRLTAGARPTRLRVAPGDCLWTITAGLLPPGVPDRVVADGWRLLYAANRSVVGPDPDLLQPGLVLHVDDALLEVLDE